MATQAQITPEWLKAQKSLTDSMKELSVTVKDIDKHFAGKVMALKAQTAQDGPFRKVLTKLRTDTKMVHKALEANKKGNEKEVEIFQQKIHSMFSEGSEVWDTHMGIMDPEKTDHYTKKALKDWNREAGKAKGRKVKKILKASKVPSLLKALAKCVQGVGAAQRGFMGHNGKFNQSYALFENAFGLVAKDLKQLATVLKKTAVSAKKMDRTSF
jgi:hypothetical protein